MADRTVKVTLTAQAQGYIAAMEKAAQATREAGSETEKLAQKQQAFEEMGRASMVAGGVMAAGLALSTKAAIDWDSAWAGVTKTVDGSPEQLAQVEAGLRSLTNVLPASHTEIAAVAEAAGQLGIATPNVVEFTKTMIDLGETTNLTAEEAATQLARFVNVMGTSQSQVSNLGAALVELGNNYATTEAEILSMAQRLSGAGTQIGMSEGQVLGLSTALSSVGIEAEAGGSAMSKVMIDIASSVDKGGDRLEQFASVAGISADQFAAKWRSDPGDALAAFVSGLANAEAQGKSTFGVLEELGITEVRMRDALLRSASAAGQFSSAMQMGNSAFEENTALVDEANKRYETTAAQLGMMRNKVVDSAISLGEHFLPAIEAVADGIGGFADLLGGLSEGPMGQFVAFSGAMATGALLVGGAALLAVPKIAAFKVALEILGVSTAGVTGKIKGIGSFLIGPWGLALAVGALAVHQFNSAMEDSKSSAQELENAIKQGESALDTMASKARENEQGITRAFVDVSQHFENLPALADKAAESGRGFWSSLTFNENAALDSIKEFGVALQGIASSDLPRAKEEFKNFAAGLTDAQALTFLNEEMAGFKSQLIDAAAAAGVATDDASLLKFAFGEIGPAADQASAGAQDGAASFDELGDSAAATQEAIAALADEVRGFNDPIFDMREANRQLEDSFLSLGETLRENGNNFDITSEAGRRNEAALDSVAEATNRAAASVYAATGDQAAMNAKLDEGRQKLVDILAPYFGTRDAAAAYVAELNLISPQKVTDIVLNGVDEAVQKLSIMDQWMDKIAQGRTAEIYMRTTVEETRIPLKAPKSANGNLFEFANGGGLQTGIYAGGPPITRFAEPETVWEAFISGKPDQRERNRQIWVETGERLGMSAAGGGVAPVVYVQNPFTGKYLLGKVDQIANAAIDGYAEEQAQAGRRAGY